MKALIQAISKEELLAEIKKHREQDQIVKGTYGEKNGKWRGCAVGCSIHSINALKKKRYQTNNHSVYETELGIPAELAYLEDVIFEELPDDEHLTWPERFINAIPVGADLSLVTAKFMIWQFEDKKYGLKYLKDVKDDTEVYGFCEEVVALYKRKIAGDAPTEKEFYDLYLKIDGARAWAWAWAGARAWARAWAGAGAWADFDKAYNEYIKAAADKLISLLEEALVSQEKDK